MHKFFYAGLIFVLSLLGGACSYFNTPTDGIYLIPKGFEGGVIILYNQPDGVLPTVENGRFLYEIPKDGLLKVKSQAKTGMVDYSYFYVDANEQREEIQYLRISGDRDVNGKPKDKFDGQIDQDEHENGIFVMNHRGIGTFNVNGSIIRFSAFSVGKPKEAEAIYEKTENRISDIQRSYAQ